MRSEDKAHRARRKLRVLTQAKRRVASVEPVSMLAPALASAVATAYAAYTLCAKKTKDPKVAVAAANAAASLVSMFPCGMTSARLGDRLRLEWLAAMPSADVNLLSECACLLGDAAVASHEGATDRLRLASAEAYSLSQAVASEAGWRSQAAAVAFLSFAR